MRSLARGLNSFQPAVALNQCRRGRRPPFYKVLEVCVGSVLSVRSKVKREVRNEAEKRSDHQNISQLVM